MTAIDDSSWDPTAKWGLHPMVAVRPETFGALVYHYDTRRLSFLKDLRLASVVSELDDGGSANEVLDRAGLSGADREAFVQALEMLSQTQMIVRR
ncbi:MAG: mycofactocin biosynthesis chaperone MftB [Candidatus Nanopelagicales bacterium]